MNILVNCILNTGFVFYEEVLCLHTGYIYRAHTGYTSHMENSFSGGEVSFHVTSFSCPPFSSLFSSSSV